jgi:riboflavin synthase alpha subunit
MSEIKTKEDFMNLRLGQSIRYNGEVYTVQAIDERFMDNREANKILTLTDGKNRTITVNVNCNMYDTNNPIHFTISGGKRRRFRKSRKSRKSRKYRK